MRKLQLRLDALEVQSFETAPASSAAGTVRGHGGSDPVPVPIPPDTGCVATYDPCTCVPIETCSCVPDTGVAIGWG